MTPQETQVRRCGGRRQNCAEKKLSYDTFSVHPLLLPQFAEVSLCLKRELKVESRLREGCDERRWTVGRRVEDGNE